MMNQKTTQCTQTARLARSTLTNVNTDLLARRLLGLMQLGGRIVSEDGHRWIITGESCYDDNGREMSEPSPLEHLMRKHRRGLTTKVYGGVLEALDRVDEMLAGMGEMKLADWWDDERLPMY